jgi:regulator of protease activity HflC (stomatin/prohibitin superfamily)
VEDYAKSTSLLASTTLRNVLGTRNLTEILTERESIAHTMQIMLGNLENLLIIKFKILNNLYFFLVKIDEK